MKLYTLAPKALLASPSEVKLYTVAPKAPLKNIAVGKAMANESIHSGSEGAAEQYGCWPAPAK